MPQNKKKKEDPRVNSFRAVAGSSLLENLSAQLFGEVIKVNADSLTLKKDKDEKEMLIAKEWEVPVTKTFISEAGEKDSSPAVLGDVRKGDLVKVNAALLPSGEWQIIGINIREDRRKKSE